MPLRGKAREGEESPDAPAQKSARRRLVTWCPCAEKRAKARSHLMPLRAPYQPSSFRWTITSVVHAPTKWCSTRSYSIVTVCSDRWENYSENLKLVTHRDRAWVRPSIQMQTTLFQRRGAVSNIASKCPGPETRAMQPARKRSDRMNPGERAGK